MRLALMQPYFFPYIGYYSILKHVDKYIYLDNVQYIKGGWINRNRILKPNGGWQYFNVPIKKFKSTDLINEIIIDNDKNWRNKIILQMQHYKKKAPFYNDTMEILKTLFSHKYESILELNKKADSLVCQYLNINTPRLVLSEMNLKYDVPKQSDEWGLNICKAVNEKVTEYWNAPGGKNFFDLNKYRNAGIKVCFQKMNLRMYKQKNIDFEPGLSILDIMMFNSIDDINEMMNDYEFI